MFFPPVDSHISSGDNMLAHSGLYMEIQIPYTNPLILQGLVKEILN